MGDCLGVGIILSFCQSCPSWVKVCLRHHNISVRQLGAVREDLLLEETLMVMTESWVRAPATSSISGLHNKYPYHTNLDILAKSKQIILFFTIFFSLTKIGIALMVWETFYNVKNGKQILLIPLKTWGCAQYLVPNHGALETNHWRCLND